MKTLFLVLLLFLSTISTVGGQTPFENEHVVIDTCQGRGPTEYVGSPVQPLSPYEHDIYFNLNPGWVEITLKMHIDTIKVDTTGFQCEHRTVQVPCPDWVQSDGGEFPRWGCSVLHYAKQWYVWPILKYTTDTLYYITKEDKEILDRFKE